MTTRNRIGTLVIGGLILAAALAWNSLNSGDSSPAPSRTAPLRSSLRPTTPHPQLHSAAARSPSRDPIEANAAELSSPVDEPTLSASRPASVSAIENYLARTIYPPDSQPLDPARHLDRIEWNTRRDTARRSPDDPDITVLYTADVHTVFGDGSIHSLLRVQRGSERQPVRIVEAYASVEASEIATPPAPVRIAYSEENGEYLNSFVPAASFPDVTGSARVRLTLRFEEESASSPRELTLNFTWSADVAGRFTGHFEDAMDDGSLVVTAEIEIATEGLYNIDANLWDADDQPVATTRWKGELTQGVHAIPLLFFGAILSDSRSIGPWRLGELRGACYRLGRTPPQEPMQPFEGTYVTHDYPLTAFSPEEWRGEQRQATLERLRRDEALGRSAPPVPLEAHLASLPRHGRGHLPRQLAQYEPAPAE